MIPKTLGIWSLGMLTGICIRDIAGHRAGLIEWLIVAGASVVVLVASIREKP